jgi:hypothetical protein
VGKTAALAGEARPGWAGRIKEVVGADRPPRARRLGVGGEDQEFIGAFDAKPGDRNRQVAPGANKNLGGEPKRLDVRKVAINGQKAIEPLRTELLSEPRHLQISIMRHKPAAALTDARKRG